MSSGGPATTTQTSTTQPPSWAIPYFQKYLQSIGQQTMPGMTVDPKTGQLTGGTIAPDPRALQQVAPFAPQQMQGMGAIGQMGAFNPLAGATQAQQGATVGGAYLGPNPYLNEYYNQAAQGLVSNYQTATAPDITAQAVAQGALGGSGQAQSQDLAKFDLGQNLATLGANIYEPAYQYERGLQQQAAGLMPQTVSGQYIAPQALIGSGGLAQSQAQNVLNTGAQNVTQQGMWPYTALQQFGQGLGTVSGGTQTTISPNLSQGIK